MQRVRINVPLRASALFCELLLATGVLAGCQSDGNQANSSYESSLLNSDQFAAGVDKAPTAETLYRMARVLEAQGKSAQAQSTLEATIARYPKFLPAYSDLAESQVRQRKVGAAILTLNRGLAADARDPVLLNNLGMCWMLKGDYIQARASFEAAAQAAPGNGRYQSNLALATAMVGRYDESISIYKQVLSGGQAHYNVAVACEARDDMARAQIEYAAAQKFDSSLKPRPRTP